MTSRDHLSLLLAAAWLLPACAGDEEGTCPAGTAGCICLAGEVCAEPGTVCRWGGCFRDPRVPEAPVCYSPCQAGLTRADGTKVMCSSAGLLEGCLGANTCEHGSCVPAGAGTEELAQALAAGDEPPVYPACERESHCPDYQTCLAGRCYSDCQADGDCASPRRCHRHVCRLPCAAGGEACPAGLLCQVTDGRSGLCLPRASFAGEEQPASLGTFSLSETLLKLGPQQRRAGVVLTNSSPRPETFTLRKVRHTVYPATGAVTVTDQPLSWLLLGTVSSPPAPTDELTLEVPPRSRVELRLETASAADGTPPRWDGELALSSPRLGDQRLRLRYASGAAGQWQGTSYTFAGFRDQGIDRWRATGDTAELENAFLVFWDEFRRGKRDLDVFLAMLGATVHGTWQDARGEELGDCSQQQNACFLYGNEDGFVTYSQDIGHQPIPGAAVELPFALQLAQGGSPTTLTGRIPTSVALHLAGDPAVRLELAEDPAESLPNEAGVVLTRVTAFSAQATVGGRYLLAGPTDPRCPAGEAGGFAPFAVPWLVEGFAAGTTDEGGQRYRWECRDQGQPVGESAGDPAGALLRQVAAGANPIPDGRARVRQLELVDGALVNGTTLLLLVRERFVSFLGEDDTAGFSAYGVLVLQRGAAELQEADTRESDPVEAAAVAEALPVLGCDASLLDAIAAATGRRYDPTRPEDALPLARLVVQGTAEDPVALEPDDPTEQVHWYCEDTGLIDGRAFLQGGFVRVPCPESSAVRYFTTRPLEADTHLPCQEEFAYTDISALAGGLGQGFTDSVVVDVVTRASCWETLQGWVRAGTHGIRLDPLWRCAGDQPECDRDRYDLRAGKEFFPGDGNGPACDKENPCDPGWSCREDGYCHPRVPVFVPASALLETAFRYKTRFRSRRGENPGFAPELCVAGSDAVPYCYDPAGIEQLASRSGCLLRLFSDHPDTVGEDRASREFLQLQFALETGRDSENRQVVVREGFERLFAELLITLGDEAYTRAFASRFDLAGAAVRSFEGSRFEPPDGPDLAGGAGYELVELYRAGQLYQLGLDRFYSLAPLLWRELARTEADPDRPSYLGQTTVTAYFERLVRLSTQKARAAAEIAQRYQRLNRPDLARRVAQRAYTATYLESVVLARLMLQLQHLVPLAAWPQVLQELEAAQRGARAALLAMREVHDGVSDEQLRFGFPPEYIPFPALDPRGPDACAALLDLAHEHVAVAALEEDEALAAGRQFDTDAARFQSELVGVRQSYETRLAELCGTFVDPAGIVRPAIAKYASLHPVWRLLHGDPCGLVGTGEVYAAHLEASRRRIELKQAGDYIDSLVAAVNIERQRVIDQCDLIQEEADFVYAMDVSKSVLAAVSDLARLELETIARAEQHVDSLSNLARCSLTDASLQASFGEVVYSQTLPVECVIAAQALEVTGAVYAANDPVWAAAKSIQLAARETIRGLQTEQTRWLKEQECEVAQVDSAARTRTLLLDLAHLELDAALAAERLRLAGAGVATLVNEARRLQQEQGETEGLLIDEAAARNDPNVRLYRNEAVLAADRTFALARRTVYQATRVCEYFTATSYAHQDDLFLVRMVARGDLSLESYLARLDGEVQAFRERYGRADLRVAVVSLKDDVLAIPRLDAGSRPFTEEQRTRQLRDRLADPRRRDARGHLVFPFAIRLEELSPRTANHKVHHLEAQILGSDLGDTLARLYLSQGGLGTLRDLQGETHTTVLPRITAVLDAIVGEQRAFAGDLFDGDVYLSRRLRDRPLASAGWELVLDLQHEPVNRDLNPQSFDDVRLYIYYTDFTTL